MARMADHRRVRIARNCLAHDGGIVPDRDVARLQTFSLVEIDEEGLLFDERTIHLFPETCGLAAESAKMFFDRLSRVQVRRS